MREPSTGFSPALARAVASLVAGRSPIEWSASIQSTPELLTPRAASLLTYLQSQANHQIAVKLSEVAGFLNRCRTIGVAEAAAEYHDPGRIAPGLYRKYLLATEAARRNASNAPTAGGAALWNECIKDKAFTSAPSRFQVGLLLNAATIILMSAEEIPAARLDEAETLLRQGLAIVSPTTPVKGMLLSTLGEIQRQRFKLDEDSNHIAAAIENLMEAIRLTPEFSPRRPMHLKGLVKAYQAAYDSSGSVEELSHAIVFQDQIVKFLAQMELYDASYLSEIYSYCSLLRTRFHRKGDASDLNASANIADATLQYNLDPDDRASALALRGEIYFESYENASPEIDDLRKARACLREALRIATPFWLVRIPCLLFAGNVFDRLIRSGVTDALDEWALTASEALHAVRDVNDRANALGNIGRYLGARFRYSSDQEDLDGAIDHLREATRSTSAISLLEHLHASLGEFLHERFDRYGGESDLDEAGQEYDYALRATDPKSPRYALRLNDKAVISRERYDRGSGDNNLDVAVKLTERALECYVFGGSFRCLLHHNLGFCLRQRYQYRRDVRDLERALSEHEKAIDGLPTTSEHLPTFLSNLGSALLEKYWATRDSKVLDRAIEVRQRAYHLVPEGTPNRVAVSHQLASALATRLEFRQSDLDLEAASDLFRQSAKGGVDVHLEEALVGARNWLLWAFSRESWGEVDESYAFVEQAISRLLAQQVLRSAKESWIKVSQNLAPRAAFARAQIGNYVSAVLALERDRARLATEALQRNATALLALRDSAHSELYSRFTLLSTRLSSHALSDGRAPQSVTTDEVRAIRSEFEEAVEEIRGTPGNESFLGQPGWEDIASVAFDQRLVYFAATTSGSVALIVSTANGESIRPVWLPKLTDIPSGEQFGAWADEHGFGAGSLGLSRGSKDESGLSLSAELESVGRWLWDVAMQPVVEALAAEEAVVLIPGGVLGRLPLHAAWVEAPESPTGRKYALDLLRIRYSPNALALAAANSVIARTSVGSIVAVLDPQPVADGPLPHSLYEADLALAILSDQLRLEGARATVDRVREALPRYSVAHFACHGNANPHAPLDSALIMAQNAPLALADILNLRLTDTRLAVLSACETGLVGVGVPDESIGLPTGLIQAGYAGVIASLWPVADESTALLMTRFYAYWLIEHLTPDEALRQAQRWLRDSSNAEILEFLSSAPLGQAAKEHWRVHLASQEARHRQRSALFHWAAFVYVGA